MITVASAVHDIIQSSPLLEDGMSRKLVNISAVARTIRPRVETITKKNVSKGAIVMALKRLEASLPTHLTTTSLAFSKPDLIIRSGLIELTYRNDPHLGDERQALYSLAASFSSDSFLTVTVGVFETTIIASSSLEKAIRHALKNSQLIDTTRELSSITVQLTPSMIKETGSIAHILRRLAWENINVVEVVSTRQELTIIVHSSDAQRAFSALHSPY